MVHLLFGARELRDLALGGLGRVPGPARRAGFRAGARAARWRARRLRNPARLLYHVTHRCDAGCEHCFLHGEGRTVEAPPLSREELARICASMPDRVRMLTFAGGEPTLLRDLARRAACFRDGPGVDRVSVVTHGGFPDRVEAIARELLALEVPAVRFQVSLDGVGEAHDAIREKPGLYPRALETLERLARLQRAHPRLDPPQVLTTVSRHNLEMLPEVVAAVRAVGAVHKLGLYRDPAQGVHGVPDEALAGPPERREGLTLAGMDPAELAAVLLPLRDALEDPAGASRAERGFDALFLRKQIDALLAGSREADCLAPWVDGVLLPDGGLAFCEESAPFAALRDYDLDLARAWASPAAEARRAQLARCHCAHPCHLSTSMAFDPAVMEAVVAR